MPGPRGAPTIATVAARGVCPRCGEGKLFDGLTAFRPACAACGLDLSRFDVGDGPAAFLTLVLGALVVVAAITVELTLHPPLWLHLLVWTPLTAVGVVWSLRVAKAALLGAEYRHDAREHRS